MVKTPGNATNLDKMENHPPGGLCCKETLRSRPGGRRKPFGGSVTFGATNKTQTKGAQLNHQMMDLLEGYLNNIAAAATQTVDPSGPLAELAASLAVSVDNVARKQQEIKRLTAQVNDFTKKVPQETKEKDK